MRRAEKSLERYKNGIRKHKKTTNSIDSYFLKSEEDNSYNIQSGDNNIIKQDEFYNDIIDENGNIIVTGKEIAEIENIAKEFDRINNLREKTVSFQKRKQYNISQKIFFINKYYEIKKKFPGKGKKIIAAELGIDDHCLREWLQQEKYLNDMNNKKEKYRLEGAGRLPDSIEYEEKLLKWIGEQRRLGIGISTNDIIYKAFEFDKTMRDKKYKTLLEWCYQLLKRYSYSIRKITHVGQSIKSSSKEDYKHFLEIVYAIRKENGDFKNNFNIFNMDETPIYFEMVSNKTIEKIGEKTVTIVTHGSERTRISLLLCISASGEKLPPLLVFKGKSDGNKIKKLKENEYVKKKKIFVECQENSWADNNIFMIWLNNVFFRHKLEQENSAKKILIMDRATTHYDKNLSKLFKDNNSSFILIPPGLTRYIQPLDVSINGPLEKKLIHWDTDFRIDSMNKKKPNEFDIINCVYKIWYDKEFINDKMIIDSFKITGISVSLDGSENHLIKYHSELSDEIYIPSELLAESNKIINDYELEMDNNTKKNIKDNNKDRAITDYFKKDN